MLFRLCAASMGCRTIGNVSGQGWFSGDFEGWKESLESYPQALCVNSCVNDSVKLWKPPRKTLIQKSDSKWPVGEMTKESG